MAKRKPKITPLLSRNFEVILQCEVYDRCGLHNEVFQQSEIVGWIIMNRETCASTDESRDWEDYYKLKRVWRRSKEDFDSACRFMKFNDLFSAAGIEA